MTRFMEKAERDAAVAMLNSAWATVLEEVGDRDVPWAGEPFYAFVSQPSLGKNPFGTEGGFSPEPGAGYRWHDTWMVNLSHIQNQDHAIEIASEMYWAMRERMEEDGNE